MPVSSMVPNPSENVDRETTSFATPPTSSIKIPGPDISINKNETLSCAVWTVSGKGCLQQEFQRELVRLFQVEGDKRHYQTTFCPGQSRLAGVMKEKFIHFDVL